MPDDNPETYALGEQVGFILRQVTQRHTNIFADIMADSGLTPTQFAAIAKLLEVGTCSQNHLGRMTAMDAATIKGVVDRLGKRALVETRRDPSDARRLIVALTETGRQIATNAVGCAREITSKTLAPLDVNERDVLLKLLKKMC